MKNILFLFFVFLYMFCILKVKGLNSKTTIGMKLMEKNLNKEINSISSNEIVEAKKQDYEINESNCEPLCYECDNKNGLSSNCKICRIGVFLYKSKCYEKCPEGTYEDNEWQVCRECDPLCPVCWGPMSNMCGYVRGVNTKVILLENEIMREFPKMEINRDFFNSWIKTLKIILKNNNKFMFGFKEDRKKFTRNINKPNPLEIESLKDFQKQNRDNMNFPQEIGSLNKFNRRLNLNQELNLSPSEVYGNNKIKLDLPFGCFSKNDGVFIPIPSYISNKINYVKNHWIYIKGQWNGFNWIDSWEPLTPKFILEKGEKSNIYLENDGYWIFNVTKGKKIFK